MADITVKKGESGFNLNFTVQNADGTVKDLTGYTGTIKVWTPDAGLLKINAAVNIANPAAGSVTYTVAAGDFDTVTPPNKPYYAELIFVKGAVTEKLTTFTIAVQDIAPT